MALTVSCSYLNSLKESVKDLLADETKHFFTTLDGPYEEDENLFESFHNFTCSIQSLHSWVDENDTLHLYMQRIFSPNETHSGKVSNTMKPFVWALGYKSIPGSCLLSEIPQDMIVKSKTDSIFLLQHFFQNEFPQVRSLQSLAFDAVERHGVWNDYTLYVKKDNTTFTNRECLLLVKDCSSMTMPDIPLFEEDEEDFQRELVPIIYPGPSDEDISSYFFSCSLATLYELTSIYRSSALDQVQSGILFHTQKLRQQNVPLYKLLLTCFQNIAANSSSLIDSAIFTSTRFIGFVLHSPLLCEYNEELLTDIMLLLLVMNKHPYMSVSPCRCCLEYDAVYQACLYFVERTVINFQNVNEIF
jgi:hypothetical protein